MDLTAADRALILDALVTLLGIALSRSAALRHHTNIPQAEAHAAQAAQITALLRRLEVAWSPNQQTTLKF